MVRPGAASRFQQGNGERVARALEAGGLGSVSINARITVVQKLGVEAADNVLLAPELAAGIANVKSTKPKGRRVGNWLYPASTGAAQCDPALFSLRLSTR